MVDRIRWDTVSYLPFYFIRNICSILPDAHPRHLYPYPALAATNSNLMSSLLVLFGYGGLDHVTNVTFYATLSTRGSHSSGV